MTVCAHLQVCHARWQPLILCRRRVVICVCGRLWNGQLLQQHGGKSLILCQQGKKAVYHNFHLRGLRRCAGSYGRRVHASERIALCLCLCLITTCALSTCNPQASGRCVSVHTG